MAAIDRTVLGENKFVKAITRFLYTDWYLVLVGFLVLAFWASQEYLAGICVLLAIASVILILQRDITPVLPIIMSAAFIVSTNKMPANFWALFLFAIPLLGAIIFHVCFYRVKAIRMGGYFFPLLLVCVACFVGGFASNRDADPMKYLQFAALVGGVPLIIYFLAAQYLEPPAGTDMPRYFAKALFYIGLVVVGEIIIYYLRVAIGVADNLHDLHLGWGVNNQVGTALLLDFPAGLYLACRKSKFAPLFLFGATLQMLCMFLIGSRGVFLVGAIVVVIGVVAYMCVNRNKAVSTIYVVSALVLLGALLVRFHSEAGAFIARVFDAGFGGSGREELYREAWGCFADNPLFGVGLGYYGTQLNPEKTLMYLFHDTPLQVLASFGLFGAFAFGWMYIRRFRVLFRKKDLFYLFLLIGYIGFEGYSLMDTGSFVPVPYMMTIALLTLVAERDIGARELVYDFERVNKKRLKSDKRMQNERA